MIIKAALHNQLPEGVRNFTGENLSHTIEGKFAKQFIGSWHFYVIFHFSDFYQVVFSEPLLTLISNNSEINMNSNNLADCFGQCLQFYKAVETGFVARNCILQYCKKVSAHKNFFRQIAMCCVSTENAFDNW